MDLKEKDMTNKEKIDAAAKKLELLNINTNKIIDLIKHDILISLYRKENLNVKADNSESDSRVAGIYEEWYGKKITDNTDTVLPFLLVGPSGQGKTTAFKVAGIEVAEALGLNFVMNPAEDYKPSKNDFL